MMKSENIMKFEKWKDIGFWIKAWGKMQMHIIKVNKETTVTPKESRIVVE